MVKKGRKRQSATTPTNAATAGRFSSGGDQSSDTIIDDPILSRYWFSPKDKQFVCQLCSYRTANRVYVRQHMVCHSDVRPFRCQYHGCRLAYKRKQELKRHIQINHLCLRPYRCSVIGCTKSFTQLQSLKDHHYSQHTDVRYRCLLTGCRQRTFNCRKNLRSHQRRRHFDDTKSGGQMFSQWINSLNGNCQVVDDKDDDNLSSIMTGLATSDDRPNAAVSLLKRKRCFRSLLANNNINSGNFGDSGNNSNGQLASKTHKRLRNASGRSISVANIDADTTKDQVFVCNFTDCSFSTIDFAGISQHFTQHWDVLLPLLLFDYRDDNVVNNLNN
ncbi:testis-specific zinc finger protein topi-like [Oppia nitens]|uniref:testis-specific zinc finger protein topi-like n=1 Tax=Oppia nitens TaxID=1686743 RepID=UPI0023DC22FF|nr:testis-specific zinc finger protein topi-like [Oppia nitens]